jgi:hypothetical protein
MNAKPKEEGLQNPSCSMPYQHFDEKSHPPIDANTQRPIQLEGKIGLLGIDHDKGQPYPKLQL